MNTVISKKNFKTIPWKNGKGQTIELAINEGGTLDDFDWRLSIATVAEDGLFSEFSGIERNLVLIEGNGLTLTHDIIHSDRLVNLLDFATFDGGSKTHAEIINGAIKDFNIMTNKNTCKAELKTFIKKTKNSVNHKGLVFVYSISNNLTITDNTGKPSTLEQGDLLKLTNPRDIVIKGQSMIMVKFTLA